MTTPNPTAGTPDLTAAAGMDAPGPIVAPAEVAAQATQSAQAGLTTTPRRSNTARVFGIIGVIVLAMVAVGVVAYLIFGLGPDAFALGGVMALVPLAIVFFGVRWIDRWEPEPKLAVLFAFLWGAVAAVVIALLVDYRVSNWVNSASGPGTDAYDFWGATVQAPIVEEGAKGLGVLIIFLVARRYFDGPIDGIVYAAWVAGGFAFTENITYFGGQLLDSGGFNGDVGQIFIIRGIMSPFAHVMFTTCTGLAIGIAARRGYGILGGIGFFLIGLIPAMLLHALWNGALYVVYDFFGYYAVVQLPLFLIAVGIVIFLRRQEAKLTFTRLTEYANAGWFKPDEVPALATGHGRRQAIAWARRNGKTKAMRRYIRDATSLAFARQRIISGRDKLGAQADEAALLGAIVESRKNLVGA
ncbi:MAG: PrsW family intrarane metalloprotease [Rhodoglobus sp.]|nr:PrsW family intrarane metalloprotease [Rhodoglobus sp.]